MTTCESTDDSPMLVSPCELEALSVVVAAFSGILLSYSTVTVVVNI